MHRPREHLEGGEVVDEAGDMEHGREERERDFVDDEIEEIQPVDTDTCTFQSTLVSKCLQKSD